MKKICVLAIDRAKKDAADACKLLATNYSLDISAYLIVSESFKATPAYKGDESNGFFKEVVIDFSDEEKLKKVIKSVTSKCEATVAHCITEAAMSDYRKVIPLIENGLLQDPRAIELASEKTKMREAFRDMYPEITPKFIIVKSFDNYSEDLVKNFSFPVIIKPNGLTASYLVVKCKNEAELEDALRNAFSSIEDIYNREYGVGEKSIIIEEFIVGELYSVDAYILNDQSFYFLPPVRVITSHEVGLDGFYGHERILPVNLSEQEIENANICVKKTSLALGLKNSTVHVEMYKTISGWKAVEIGPRIGGYRQELYKLVYGIEHFYNDMLVHLGEKPIIKTKVLSNAAAINIYAPTEGTIRSIKGTKEASKVVSMKKITTHAKIGSNAKFASNGGKYIIDAIMSSDDMSVLTSDINKVRSTIEIEVEKLT